MRTKPLAVIPAIAIAVLAGCSTENGAGEGGATTDPAEASAAPEVLEGQPIEFDLPVPEGFTLVDGEDREELLAENHLSYVFTLDGGTVGNRILVTSYVVDQEIASSDFDTLLPIIAAYDESRGFGADPELYRHALVNRVPGVHRYLEIEVDGTAAKEYTHYIGQGSHLIQITCQWSDGYDAVMAACGALEQEFPVPTAWEPQA
ncbi:hypothetical protein [Glycomyces tarimensis]